MIDFIICDDDKNVCKKVTNIIDKIMMKNKQAYRISIFSDYDNKFLEYIKKKKELVIYILDIVTPSRSGIDIARKIRKNDVDSVIIFLTGHDELGPTILKKELLFLSFINKFDEAEEMLTNAIKKSLHILNVKKVLKFEEKSVIYIISLNDILYIKHDNSIRKSIIKTTGNEYSTYKSLVTLIKMLDGRFVRIHRSCIVNFDRINAINKKDKIVTFDNNENIDLLSLKYLKELKKNVR